MSQRCAIALFFALGSVLAQAQEAKPAPPPRTDVAIVGARIEVGNGRTIAKGTVIVRDGKITEVTPGTKAPAGMAVVVADGMVLYPGFIDGFTTRGVKAAPTPSEDGRPDAVNTAPPTMWIGNRKGITAEWRAASNLDLDRDETAYKAGLTTALITPGRGFFRGTGAVVDLLPSTVEDRVIVPEFGMGFSFRGGGGQGYPGNILGFIALMRQTLFDARALAQGAPLDPEPGDDKKPAWMASLEALIPLVEGRQPAVFDVSLDREILRAFRLADEFGFKVVVAGGRDAYLVADALAKRRVPVMLNPALATEPDLDPPAQGVALADQTPMEFRKERHAKWEEQARGAETLAKAGVAFAFSSEGDALSDFLGNVRALVKRGLPKPTALRALTLGAAEILGIADRTGSVEVGKRANLVLMSGDFDNEKSEVRKVWIDGRSLYEAKEAGK
ncbi:MAG: amidohydrolase family protein [Fimbriimonadaceae bacterium]|nr:amidohydrolase family protein [Fimbriimonadaceae bacterium]